MHVGMPNKHTGNVTLILNFELGNITAQWNAVFNDWFSAVTQRMSKTCQTFMLTNGQGCFGPAHLTLNPMTKSKNQLSNPHNQPDRTLKTMWPLMKKKNSDNDC